MTTLTTADLTAADTEGTGVFDVLMRAVKAHLDAEFKRGSIKGAEYSTVYLGSLNLAMQTGLSFLLQQQKSGLEVSLLEKQLLLAQTQVDKAAIELAMLFASQDKIPAEIAQLTAQTAMVTQQTANLVADGLNTPKQGLVMDAQKAQITQQTTNLATEKLGIESKTAQTAQQTSNLAAEALNIPKQGTVLTNQGLQVAQQTANLTAETLNVPKQGVLLDAQAAISAQQKSNLVSEGLGIVAKTAQAGQQTSNLVTENLSTIAKTSLTAQQKLNAVIEGTLLTAKTCESQAQFHLITSTTEKSAGEIVLLAQKTATEKAQIQALGVDADSVVGKQKALYGAQTTGFARDAEQKAAKLMADTWSVRRTTDEGTIAGKDPTKPESIDNMLGDANLARAITKLLSGVGA
jgi:hypothetical protein